MKNYQNLFNENYDKKFDVHELICQNCDLTGNIDLSDFPNLEILDCYENNLTSLKLDNCKKLKWIYCRDNNLHQDLSVFSRFVNLENLYVYNNNEEKIKKGIYNRFYGSLEYLKDFNKITKLTNFY